MSQYLELKEQGFEFEGQSYLFWEYMRILTDIRKHNPDVKFLLENVEMGAKWERILSEAIGVYGVHINSALVSAQNRKRIYWTNIRTKQVGLFGELHSDIPQPKDRGILLKDILESDVDDKYFLSDKMLNYLTVQKNRSPSDIRTGSPTEQRLEPNLNGKTNCLTSVQKDNLVMCLTPKRTEYGKQIRKQYESGEVSAMRKEVSQLEPREDGKTNTITTVQKDNLLTTQSRIRRLTPTECARLQTIPEWYKWECSSTQQYKMCGNGWTVEVIKHILSFIDFN